MGTERMKGHRNAPVNTTLNRLHLLVNKLNATMPKPHVPVHKSLKKCLWINWNWKMLQERLMQMEMVTQEFTNIDHSCIRYQPKNSGSIEQLSIIDMKQSQGKHLATMWIGKENMLSYTLTITFTLTISTSTIIKSIRLHQKTQTSTKTLPTWCFKMLR